MLSWFTAVTVTPLLGTMFLKAPKGEPGADPYGGQFYRVFGGFLRSCINLRWVTLIVVLAVFVSAVFGFGKVSQSFFPNSTRPQFLVDYWLPQGTSIDRSNADAQRVEQYMLGLDGVTHVAAVVAEASRTVRPRGTTKGSAARLCHAARHVGSQVAASRSNWPRSWCRGNCSGKS